MSHLQTVYEVVLVTSTNIVSVERDIFVTSLFVIGGSDMTCSELSNKHGNKGLPSSKYKYLCIPEYTLRFFSLRKFSASVCNCLNRVVAV